MSYTPEEQATIDAVRDLMRGGPKKRLENFANSINVTYDELIWNATEHIKTDGVHYWSEGAKFEGTNVYDGFWADFELATGIVAPPEIRNNWGFFSCSC